MLFEHKGIAFTGEKYYLDSRVEAVGSALLCNSAYYELFHGFTFRCSSINIADDGKLHFIIGDAEEISTNGEAYSINITPKGVCVCAESEENLRYGFMTFLDLIRMEDCDRVYAECCQIRESPTVGFRSLHYCVFPETELWELTRMIRLCAALKYTHLILEFWGMYRYECNDKLNWEHAFSKEDLRIPLSEAKALGLEIVPMFNHWGHASQCRQVHGKHVTLDSHPELQAYFSDSGWCWNYKNPQVRKLLSAIRRELIELCGEGEYFHLGGDEAEEFCFETGKLQELCDYINETAKDLSDCGRRPIMWGDMLLYDDSRYNKDNNYSANCPDKESQEFIISHLDRSIIIADWQYWAEKAPIETSLTLKNQGFDTLICPWDRSLDALNSCLKTAVEHELFGAMQTTWHTLTSGMPYVSCFARLCWGDSLPANSRSRDCAAAAFQRKVFFADGDYEKSGWSKAEIGID